MTSKQNLKNTLEEKNKNYLNTLIRLIFLGIGLGIVAGTILKTIDINAIKNNPKILNKLSLNQRSERPSFTQLKFKNRNKKKNTRSPITFKTKNEISALSSKWRELLSKRRDLKAGAFILILDNGNYAELNPDNILPAASSIKTAILLITLEMIDSGLIKWDEKLNLTKDVIGGGAGWMAYQALGTSFPVYEIATEMIRISDNTATNLLIKRLGGKILINRRFKQLGLESTEIRNFLPDLEGTNTTSAKDLSKVFALVDTGDVLSHRSKDLFREIMATSTSNRLLPGGLLKGLGGGTQDPDYNLMIKGYKVYNKTGDIGISYADAGLIQLPNNTRAVAGFIVKGPFNDPRSAQLIRDMASAMAPFLMPQGNAYD